MTTVGDLTSRAPRLLGAGSVALGVTLLVVPGRVAAAVSDTKAVPLGVVRLLGARYVAQGVAQLRWPSADVLVGASVVDGLHGLSMAALAAANSHYRRPALLSFAVAAAGSVANAFASQGVSAADH